MLVRGPVDLALDAEEVAHERDLAERHAGLHHAERTGVHPEQDDATCRAAEALEVRLVRRAGVHERVVHARDRRAERQTLHRTAQIAAHGDERHGDEA